MTKQKPPAPARLVHQPDVTVPLSKNAVTVLERRYLVKDDSGKVIETPDEMFHRVAHNLAQAEARYGGDVAAWEARFYAQMRSLEFLPNSPTLMNAGRPLQQLSACFVLPVPDDLGDIFSTIRNQAIIHQTGGGCIAGDARVWTTFCGIEPIEVLVNRATVDGRPALQHGTGLAYDVRDLDIRTLSMNPTTGETGLRPVTHVWRFDVPAEHQIVVTMREGASVQTSDWHPFMVVRGTQLVEVRADALVPDDVVLGPERPDTFWPWTAPRSVGSLTIDPDLGWLIGFTLGDGSFGYVPALRQYRVRWFSGTPDVLERARDVLAGLGIHVSIQKDARGLLSVATLTQRFVHDLLEACGLEKFGPKDDLIRVPEAIAKSPLPVIRAFLAGLLDSDGYVAPDGSPSYSSASAAMAQDLAALVSLLGYQPIVRTKDPYGKGRSPISTVQLCPLPQVNELASDLLPYLANTLRRSRLLSGSRKQTAICLPIAPWRDRLKALGLVKSRGDKAGGPGPCSVELNRWSHSEFGRVRRDSLRSMAAQVAPLDSALAYLLRRIADSGQQVAQTARATVAKPFYDLSVADWNTYAAGQSGLAMIHNTGFAFSQLRPKNDIVMTTKGKASGPVSFMQVFDAATGAIKQGGTRRGANMAILSIDHPDIEEFIDMKNDLSVMTNFNVSVALTEQFMEEVERGEDHALVNPRTGAVARKVPARTLFDKIVHSAWQTGEPGIVFIDRINNSRSNPTPQLGAVESTNPCGEQPLLPYEACNLGSINVGRLTVEQDGQPALDWDTLREVVHVTTRALEDVIEMNKYPIPEIEEMTTRNRRIGVGLMGWADLLYKLRIPYNSEEAIDLAERMMRFIDDEAKNASEQLAAERGPFPNWEESIYGPRGQHWPNAQGVRPLRNSTVTTIAPTGTISIIAGASGGIEPLFSLAFMRTIMDRDRMLEVNEIFEQVARAEGFYSAELMEEVAAAGTLAGIAGVPDWVKRVFVTARDVTPEWHARMQAAFQKYTDNAVSKTCNFPAEATEDQVREVYQLAYQLGCKGVTIYRDGSRAEQPMSNVEKKKDGQAAAAVAEPTMPLAASAPAGGGPTGNGHNGNGQAANGVGIPEIDAEVREADEQPPVNLVEPQVVLPRPLPDGDIGGWLGRMKSPQGTVRVWVSEVDGQPYETYVVLGKSGSDLMALTEAIGRMMSIALRAGIPVEILIDQLRGIGGSRSVGFGAGRVLSVPDAIAKLLQEHYFPDGTASSVAPPAVASPVAARPLAPPAATTVSARRLAAARPLGDICPECGNATLMHVEGCKKCPCGHSEC